MSEKTKLDHYYGIVRFQNFLIGVNAARNNREKLQAAYNLVMAFGCFNKDKNLMNHIATYIKQHKDTPLEEFKKQNKEATLQEVS